MLILKWLKIPAALIFVALLCQPTISYSNQAPTGKTWSAWDQKEKIIFVYSIIQNLKDSEVEFSLNTLEYAELMEQYLNRNPDLLKYDLADLFGQMVYTADPLSRKGLEKFIDTRIHESWTYSYSEDRSIESYYEELGLNYTDKQNSEN